MYLTKQNVKEVFMENNLGVTPSIVIGGNVVTMAPNNKCVVINIWH